MKKIPGILVETIVGHLPREISRYTNYIIMHGANVTATVVSTKERRSPLIQGGIEIPVYIKVEMDTPTENEQTVKFYKDFVEKNYAEPIDGKFKDATGEILKALAEEEESDADGNEDFDIEEMEEV